MKNEKGITMISLVIYVITLTFIIAGVSAITTSFYKNLNQYDSTSKGAVAFSKFNMYILNDIKSEGVTVETGSGTQIRLKIGNESVIYKVQNNSLYRNNVKICENLREAKMEANASSNTITVYLNINNYEKTTTYKLEPKSASNTPGNSI